MTIFSHVSFSSDSHRVVTAVGQSAQVWKWRTGQPVTGLFGHTNHIMTVSFSPDGRRVLTASLDGTARIWDVAPSHQHRIPDWFPGFAECVNGARLNEETGLTEAVPVADFLAVQERIMESNDEDDYTRIAKWVLTPALDRTISPFSRLSTRMYIEQRIAEGTKASCREAAFLSFGDQEVQEKLRMTRHLEVKSTEDSQVKEYAFFNGLSEPCDGDDGWQRARVKKGENDGGTAISMEFFNSRGAPVEKQVGASYLKDLLRSHGIENSP